MRITGPYLTLFGFIQIWLQVANAVGLIALHEQD